MCIYIYIYIYIYILRERERERERDRERERETAVRSLKKEATPSAQSGASPLSTNSLSSVAHFRGYCLRDKKRSNNSPPKFATLEENSQLGSNCTNSKAPENSGRPRPAPSRAPPRCPPTPCDEGGKACLFIRKHEHFTPTREIRRHVRTLARHHAQFRRCPPTPCEEGGKAGLFIRKHDYALFVYLRTQPRHANECHQTTRKGMPRR